MTSENWTKFVRGDRVQMSAKGKRALGRGRRKRVDLSGTVVSKGKNFYVSVRWDGNAPSSINTYHPSYLEKVS